MEVKENKKYTQKYTQAPAQPPAQAPAPTPAPTQNQQYINDMYNNRLESQKNQIQQGYDNNLSGIDRAQEKQQAATDANLSRTYVEAAKADKNFNELQNAYGLTSGAMAQANLAQENQLQADLTALRAKQFDADADFENQRLTLGKQYEAAIKEAVAQNDMERARALYEEAARAEQAAQEQQRWQAEYDYRQSQDQKEYERWLQQMEHQKAMEEADRQRWEKEFGYRQSQDAQAQQNWQAEYDEDVRRYEEAMKRQQAGGGPRSPGGPEAPKAPPTSSDISIAINGAGSAAEALVEADRLIAAGADPAAVMAAYDAKWGKKEEKPKEKPKDQGNGYYGGGVPSKGGGKLDGTSGGGGRKDTVIFEP